MQLVRTAQSKHKINLLALSTEDGGPYVVATWYVVSIVCSSYVPLNSNTNTSSHSPRRTGGPQAPASGALVIYIIYLLFRGLFPCLKKNLNTSRPSEHPPVRGKNLATFRWDHRLQRQTSSWRLNGFAPHAGAFNMPTSYQ